jgi:hypothetical protein
VTDVGVVFFIDWEDRDEMYVLHVTQTVQRHGREELTGSQVGGHYEK